MDFSKFESLENKVAAMLDRLSALTARNAALEAELGEKDRQLQAARNDLGAAEGLLKEMETEKTDILARVDAILAKLQQMG